MDNSSTALAPRDGVAPSMVVSTRPEPVLDFAGASFSDKLKMAELIANSSLVPKDFFKKPGDILIVCDLGASVGLTPSQSLQTIASINGRACIWGDGLIGIVRNSPKCEWIEEVEVGELGKDTYGWRCTAKRRGDPHLITNTFTIRQAKQAKLFTKSGPWTDYGPERMCRMRARAWTCRDGFADMLKGLAMREEVVDIPDSVRDAIVNAPTRADAIKAALAARQAIEDAPAVEDAIPPNGDAPDGTARALPVATASLEPTTEERITMALDAAAKDDPDFARMKGADIRQYLDSEAMTRGVEPPELSAIEAAEREKTGGKLTRPGIAFVLRYVREHAMRKTDEAARADEIPEIPETPAPAPAPAPDDGRLL